MRPLMILSFLVFWPVGSKLLVYPQDAFDAAPLVCRIWNHRRVNSFSEFAVAVLAVRYHTSQSGCRPFENQLCLLQNAQRVFLLVLVCRSKSASQRKHALRVDG